jgi:hypothetical protein
VITPYEGGKRPPPRPDDLNASEVKLVSAHTGKRSLGSTYFSREVRESAQVIAEKGCRIGKLRSGKLHTVTAVPCKLDNHIIKHIILTHEKISIVKIGGRR